MKCTSAIMRRAIAHHENAKKRNDRMLKSHYSMQPGVGKINKERSSNCRSERWRLYFLRCCGAVGGAAGPAARLSFTDCGSLLALATSKLTCHSCVLESVF